MFPPDPVRPTTTPPPRPKQPTTSFRPKGLRDILKPTAIRKIRRWLRLQKEDLERMAKQGPTARRQFKEILIIGQDEVYEQARGIIWDLRPTSRRPDGTFPPWDFDKPIETHLNLDFIRLLETMPPDKALFDDLLNGVTFRADVGHDGVFMPHLTSLPKGLTKVGKEIDRFLGLGWYEQHLVDLDGPEPDADGDVELLGVGESDDAGDLGIPVWPIRIVPQGSVARKLEPDRPRRTTDGSAPRKS